jgi:MoaA/NifB/PqqE/SkfB family radical SAM enzyme
MEEPDKKRRIDLDDTPMLGFQLSLNCNARCRICNYDCSAIDGPVVSEARVKGILNQVEGLKLKPIIAFSGGEPFLHYDLLKNLGKFIQKHIGYKLNISTNGFWATSPKRARTVLGELAGLGLVSLLFSVDDFHSEYIGLKRVETGVKEAVRLGIACHLQCIETRSSRKIDWYRENMDIPDDEKLVKWSANPCDPIGRANRSIPPEELIRNWKNKPDKCTMFMIRMVSLEGEVYNCCGSANMALPSAGNAFHEPLPDIIHRANADPVLNAIAAWGGPYLLANLLAENGFSRYAKLHYTSACHACHDIFNNPEAVFILKEKLASRQGEMVALRLLAWAMYREWSKRDEGGDLPVPASGYETTNRLNSWFL